MSKQLTSLSIAFFFVIFVSFVGYSQTATATLSGTVEDQNADIIPGASITVQNRATSFERTAATNDSGQFTVPLLPPGTYAVTVRREGFTQVEVSNVTLNVGDQKSLRVELKVGDVNAAIEVRPDENLVSTSPAVATTIDRTFVGNLPLNGRSFQSLILLTPGVTVTRADAGVGGFSVNGQRSSTNYFTVDGVSANIGISPIAGLAPNRTLAGGYPGTNAFGGTNNLVSVDALEEYKIQTSTYTAELGRQPGGQVSLVTRSGSNRFHGTVFEYLRNEAFDARDYFNKKPAPKPPLRQNQFGGTFSGPLPFFNFGEGGPMFTSGKDRTFFFFSYEGQRLLLPTSGTMQVPSLRLRSDAPAAIKPILNAFPQPTGPEILDVNGAQTGWSPRDFGVSNPSAADAISIRVDHTLSSKHILFGRFNESPSDSTFLSTFDGGTYISVSNAATRTLTLGATSVLGPGLNNELRFNYSRQQSRQHFVPANYGGGVPVDPSVLTSGFDGTGGVFLSYGGFFGQVFGGDIAKHYQRQLNIVDNVLLVVGSHQFKFGIDVRRLSPILGVQDSQTAFFFSEASVIDAIADQVSILANDSARPTISNYSVYAQDTWKVTPRLTLDLGLRWELNPAPTEADGKLPVAVIGVTDSDVSMATLAPAGTPFFKTFWGAFAPRFGAAYQLRTKPGHETVLRGGFGVYYDLGNSTALSGFPFSARKTLFGVPFPLSEADAARPTPAVPTSMPVTVTVFPIDPNLKLPYTLQWNLAVEQSLGKAQTLSLSYVASAGRRLLAQENLNNFDTRIGRRPNPNFASIFYVRNRPTSDYSSFQAQYKTRFTRGLQTLVNYTWSHSIDEASTDATATAFARGNSDFDIRHNFSAAFTYDLPSSKVPILTHILGGWSVNGIVHAQSGLPIEVRGGIARLDGRFQAIRPDVVAGRPLYVSDPTVAGGRRFNSAAFARPPFSSPTTALRQGNVGRNVLRGLPLYQLDMALGRTFKFREKLGLQLKGEVFNVFNHPMFGNYNNLYTSSIFGVPTFTLGGSLGGLSQLYQIGGPRSIQLSLRLNF